MAETFQVAWERASQYHGWLDEIEAWALWDYCDGVWCEVGCWKGRSTAILAETGHPGYAIDWFQGSPEHGEETNTLEEFRKNIPDENVTVFAERFEYAAWRVPNTLQLLHLDADHSYRSTKLAFNLYAYKVMPGGYMLVHDAWDRPWNIPMEYHPERRVIKTAWPEVSQFVLEIADHPQWKIVDGMGRFAIFKRI